MTTRLTPAQQAAIVDRLSSTYGKAYDAAAIDAVVELIDPSSSYPPGLVWAAVERVCSTQGGYAPRPADINSAIQALARQALDAAPARTAPSGLDGQAYTDWVRHSSQDALDAAFPPGALDAAAERTARALGASAGTGLGPAFGPMAIEA